MRLSPVERHAPVRGAKRWLADRSDGTRLHAGVDLAAPRGTPVRAPEAGEVLEVARSSPGYPARVPWTGYGPEVVLLRGDSGRYHLLSHVQGARVVPGQRVEAGEHVADVSELRHVHWEVRSQPRRSHGLQTVEISQDPLAWLEGNDVPFDRGQPQRCPPKVGPKTPRACRVKARRTPPAMAPTTGARAATHPETSDG